MATTVLTGRALQQYLARQQNGEGHWVDDVSAEPFAVVESKVDSEDALLEYLNAAQSAADRASSTAEISRAEILAELSNAERPARAAG